MLFENYSVNFCIDKILIMNNESDSSDDETKEKKSQIRSKILWNHFGLAGEMPFILCTCYTEIFVAEET